MEFLVALLGLGSLLVGIVALVGIVRPMPRIGLKTRKMALGILVLSFISFDIAAGISSESARRGDGHWWQWILFAIAAYGLFRLVRRGKQMKGSVPNAVPLHSPSGPPASDVAPTVPAHVPNQNCNPPVTSHQSGLGEGGPHGLKARRTLG